VEEKNKTYQPRGWKKRERGGKEREDYTKVLARVVFQLIDLFVNYERSPAHEGTMTGLNMITSQRGRQKERKTDRKDRKKKKERKTRRKRDHVMNSKIGQHDDDHAS